MQRYDLAIVGGGPAGYLAAERAAARGLSVVLAEERFLGGVCLNEGCIPTKTLIHGAKLLHQARESERFGVTTAGARYDLAAAMAHKNRTVQALRGGVASMIKKHKVDVVEGHARLLGPGAVEAGGRELRARHVLLANGATSARPPIPGVANNPHVLTSREILDLETLPQRLTVIGGGYIGMEFAAYFSAVGVAVTVVEMMDEIIPMLEPKTAQALRRMLPSIDYRLAHRVERIDGADVVIRPRDGGDEAPIAGDLVLLATGRVPNVADAGFESAGLAVDRTGVTVDDYMQTNLPEVYAAGDVTGRMLLAHAAYRMAEVAVAHMTRPTDVAAARATWPNRMRYHAIPWVVFTAPEVAGCGQSATDAEAAGKRVVSETVPLRLSGRYLAEHPDERGTLTMVADATDGRVLGVQMLGSGVGELIHSVAVMIEQELRVADLREIVFPHPTVSEVLRDAAWAVEIDSAPAH